MTYPKQVMRIAELEKLGLSKSLLMTAYRRKGQTYAWKMNPMKANSPIVFDTEAFEKWRIQMISGRVAAI